MDEMGNLPHDNWAIYYDFVYETTYGAVYRQFTNTTIETVTGLCRAGHIIELGAGTGRLAIPLRQMGYEVTAVEPSTAMAEVLGDKIANEGLNITIVNENAGGFRANQADLILAVFTVLSYITDENVLTASIENIGKHLNSGGLFLFDLPGDVFFNQAMPALITRPSLHRRISINRNKGNLYQYSETCQGEYQGQAFEYNDTFPLRKWTIDELDRLLVNAGFENTQRTFPRLAGTGSAYYLYQKL